MSTEPAAICERVGHDFSPRVLTSHPPKRTCLRCGTVVTTIIHADGGARRVLSNWSVAPRRVKR